MAVMTGIGADFQRGGMGSDGRRDRVEILVASGAASAPGDIVAVAPKTISESGVHDLCFLEHEQTWRLVRLGLELDPPWSSMRL